MTQHDLKDARTVTTQDGTVLKTGIASNGNVRVESTRQSFEMTRDQARQLSENIAEASEDRTDR